MCIGLRLPVIHIVWGYAVNGHGAVGWMTFQRSPNHKRAEDIGDRQNEGQSRHRARDIRFKGRIGTGSHGGDRQRDTG